MRAEVGEADALTPCQSNPAGWDNDDTAALAACRSCPARIPCALTALTLDVAGVVGGMTETDRQRWRDTHHVPLRPVHVPLTDRQIIADHKGTPGRSPLIAEVIARRAGRGEDDGQIGREIGLSVEGVGRYRRQFGIPAGQPRADLL